MKKLQQILSFCLLLCMLAGCSMNTQNEQFGDSQLKKTKKMIQNFYIGISENKTSFDEAYSAAFQNALGMISNELGITVSSSTMARTIVEETNTNLDISFYLQREMQLDSEHDIKTRVNRIYHEKKSTQNGVSHKVWVELYFDTATFYAQYNEFWSHELKGIRAENSVQSFERLMALKNKFENEEKYLRPDIQREYHTLLNQFMLAFQKNNIAVNATQPHKFSNNFLFVLTKRNSGDVLQNFPVKINNQNFVTNHQGTINYTADYAQKIVILIGHNLDNHLDPQNLIIYQNDTFSPMFAQNVTINIISSDMSVKDTFTSLFQDKGFQIGNNADITLNIVANSTTRRISVNEYLTELRYEIRINNSIYYIPSERNEFIRGYGNTEKDAFSRSVSIDWLRNREPEISRIIRLIQDILIY